MERRLELYERIKTSKLNKLTIKQGDVNVKLNLKRDLVDPSVEISDKVLEMLESYADKNSMESKRNLNEADKTLPPSPTKRVRFDINEPELETQIENLKKVSDVQPSFIEPVGESGTENSETEKLSEQQYEQESQTESENKKEFSCRLCKLKCSNERALHEHVSRIHGGKGAFNHNFISKLKSGLTATTEDEDYEESSDLEDLESQDDAYLSSSSDSKKSNFNKDRVQPPRPNVAIRVAKVAYYNSKGSINSNNPFKSNIFKQGGIRGNFFSQERLPLRSCKIKMKLTSNLNKTKDKLNEFLINNHVVSKNEFVESNKTISTQTSTLQSDQNLINDFILSESEIRQFFKSLLDYIPISNVPRLDDLIKQNESFFNLDENLVLYLKHIHDIILNSKQFGINLYNLKFSLNKILLKDNLKEVKMNLIKKLLYFLLTNHLVLAVGVVERVYVTHEFKQHWVIESYKNQRGRGYYDEEEIQLDEEQENEKQTDNDALKNSKNFKPICLIPRPWRYIDGLLNRPVLKKMLESIILYLKTYPNSSIESISNHYCPVLQPIMTLELLEMLEKLKCIQKLTLKKENDCDLFSDFTNGSHRILNEDDLDGNELFTYYLNQSSIFNIKKVFPN